MVHYPKHLAKVVPEEGGKSVEVANNTSVSCPEQDRSHPVRLALEYITEDSRLQSRKLRPDVVEDYAAAMRRGVTFAPVRVVYDGEETYYLVDGHHRVAAARQLTGIDKINVEIIEGSFTDALWHSWAANRGHGLRRTKEEIRRAIRAALAHPEWSKQSDRKIGQHIGCDHKTVGAVRRNLRRGEFPTRESIAPSDDEQVAAFEPAASRQKPPSKDSILRACQVLMGLQAEHLGAFTETELAGIRAAGESVCRLLDGPIAESNRNDSGSHQ